MADAISYRGVTRANQQQALAEYLEAQKLARRLVEMSPEDGARQRDLMFVHQKIGDMRQALGDLDAAIAEYRAALTLIQNVAAGAPENRGWRRDVANTLRKIGQVQSAKNDFDEALEQLKAALEIMTSWCEKTPTIMSHSPTSRPIIATSRLCMRNAEISTRPWRRTGAPSQFKSGSSPGILTMPPGSSLSLPSAPGWAVFSDDRVIWRARSSSTGRPMRFASSLPSRTRRTQAGGIVSPWQAYRLQICCTRRNKISTRR